MLRTRCGVIASTISVFLAWSSVAPNSRSRIGNWPIPGTLLPEVRSSLSIRPASTSVSLFFSCSTVLAVRVPIWYAAVPVVVVTALPRLLTSSASLMPIVSSR